VLVVALRHGVQTFDRNPGELGELVAVLCALTVGGSPRCFRGCGRCSAAQPNRVTRPLVAIGSVIPKMSANSVVVTQSHGRKVVGSAWTVGAVVTVATAVADAMSVNVKIFMP
jgi:hypothetical protein